MAGPIGLQAALPGSIAARPSLDALWPNEDGRFWEYSYRSFRCGTPGPIVYYPTYAEVPPAPSLEEIAAFLRRPPGGGGPATCVGIIGSYRLEFDGRITTLSGVTAQNLRETLTPDEWAPARPESGPASPLLQRIAAARPDLAQRIAESSGGRAVSAGGGAVRPLLLHGYAWEKTAAHIGTYGDVDQDLAWKFLEADFSPGSGFTFELVPTLAEDVFLHALILRRPFQTLARELGRGTEVLYLVDYGIAEALDANGQTLGFFRRFDYGSILYVPGVGPVASWERNGLRAGEPLSQNGIQRIDLRLRSTGLTDTAFVAGR